jgi:transcriptional regulator with XRE-family HTH domain
LLAILLGQTQDRLVSASSLGPIGEQLLRLATDAGMNYDMLARALGVSRRSISGWLSGREPERINRVRITEFERLVAELRTVVKPEQLKTWWNRPVANFGGSTPLQVLERGETDRIWRMIWEIREGNSGD